MKTRIVLALAASVGLAACQGDDLTPTAAVPANAAASQEDLFTLLPNAALTNAQQSLLSTIRSRPSTAGVNVARLASVPAGMLQHGRAVRFNVAPGRPVVAVGSRVEERGPSDISWGGPVQGQEGSVQMVLSGEGVTATVRVGEDLYHVEPLGGGLHAISQVNQAALPPEHAPDNPSGALIPSGRTELDRFEAGDDFMASMAATTQTVLVVYTASAASATSSITNLIQLAVDETNTSYLNSGVGITSLRVHTAQVTYNEAHRSYSQHVNALKSTTDGIMDNVHTLRNTYAADLVVLVVNDSEACGMAAAIKATASTGFAVAHYTCITGYYSFGHEIGHLQGARHDRAVDSSTSPYAYGHGYVSPTKDWRTVMAYGNACSNCKRVQYWSNPNVTYPTTGQAMGTVTYENNARVLNETAATIAAFR
jgi:hypothetical protein